LTTVAGGAEESAGASAGESAAAMNRSEEATNNNLPPRDLIDFMAGNVLPQVATAGPRRSQRRFRLQGWTGVENGYSSRKVILRNVSAN
jgi:hypothetical protein